VLESGVHATLAGVLAALFIPVRVPGKHDRRHLKPVSDLQHGLHPWVAFLVLPVFGFANAGVPFAGMGLNNLLEPVTLGIIAGLFVGKQIGVFTCIAVPVKLGLFKKPEGATWSQIYAVSLLCGIGFTMSLFIGGLAFSGFEMQASVRLGVLVGSVLSAVLALAILRFGPSHITTTIKA
jgi:Na+:H+ antiporter, NhaA family